MKRKIKKRLCALTAVFMIVLSAFNAVAASYTISVGETLYISMYKTGFDKGKDSYQKVLKDYSKKRSEVEGSNQDIDTNDEKILRNLGFTLPDTEEEINTVLENGLPSSTPSSITTKVFSEDEFWSLVAKHNQEIWDKYLKEKGKNKGQQAVDQDATYRDITEAFNLALDDVNPYTGEKNDHNAFDDLDSERESNKNEVTGIDRDNHDAVDDAREKDTGGTVNGTGQTQPYKSWVDRRIEKEMYDGYDYTILDLLNDEDARKLVENDVFLRYNEKEGFVYRCALCGAEYSCVKRCECEDRNIMDSSKIVNRRAYKYADNHGYLSTGPFSTQLGAIDENGVSMNKPASMLTDDENQSEYDAYTAIRDTVKEYVGTTLYKEALDNVRPVSVVREEYNKGNFVLNGKTKKETGMNYTPLDEELYVAEVSYQYGKILQEHLGNSDTSLAAIKHHIRTLTNSIYNSERETDRSLNFVYGDKENTLNTLLNMNVNEYSGRTGIYKNASKDPRLHSDLYYQAWKAIGANEIHSMDGYTEIVETGGGTGLDTASSEKTYAEVGIRFTEDNLDLAHPENAFYITSTGAWLSPRGAEDFRNMVDNSSVDPYNESTWRYSSNRTTEKPNGIVEWLVNQAKNMQDMASRIKENFTQENVYMQPVNQICLVCVKDQDADYAGTVKTTSPPIIPYKPNKKTDPFGDTDPGVPDDPVTPWTPAKPSPANPEGGQTVHQGEPDLEQTSQELQERVIQTPEYNDPTYKPFGYWPKDPSKWTKEQKELYDRLYEKFKNSQTLKDWVENGAFDPMTNIGTKTPEEAKREMQKVIDKLKELMARETSINETVTVTATFDINDANNVILDQTYDVAEAQTITITDRRGKQAPVKYTNVPYIYFMGPYVGKFDVKYEASYYKIRARLVTYTGTYTIKAVDKNGKEIVSYSKKYTRIREDVSGLKESEHVIKNVGSDVITVKAGTMDLEKSDFFATERFSPVS